MTITVAGRPAAVIWPATPRARRQWPDLADLFREPMDTDWRADDDRLDDAPVDPWARP